MRVGQPKIDIPKYLGGSNANTTELEKMTEALSVMLLDSVELL